MTDKQSQQQPGSSSQGSGGDETQDTSNLKKDPDEWVTGDEPMTGAQASYLKTLSEENGEAFDATLTKAEASKLIDELRQRTPRLQNATE